MGGSKGAGGNSGKACKAALVGVGQGTGGAAFGFFSFLTRTTGDPPLRPSSQRPSTMRPPPWSHVPALLRPSSIPPPGTSGPVGYLGSASLEVSHT